MNYYNISKIIDRLYYFLLPHTKEEIQSLLIN